jgi:hypothetical protein
MHDLPPAMLTVNHTVCAPRMTSGAKVAQFVLTVLVVLLLLLLLSS